MWYSFLVLPFTNYFLVFHVVFVLVLPFTHNWYYLCGFGITKVIWYATFLLLVYVLVYKSNIWRVYLNSWKTLFSCINCFLQVHHLHISATLGTSLTNHRCSYTLSNIEIHIWTTAWLQTTHIPGNIGAYSKKPRIWVDTL